MKINGVIIDDTYAEAFAMYYVRALVTAADHHWLDAAIRQSTGLATSIVGCEVEAGREMFTIDTPDKRLGAYLLFFARDKDKLITSLIQRFGQAILTCPTTKLYDGAAGGDPADIGARLRYFGDGLEEKVVMDGKTMWQIAVSEGAFVVEESFNINRGVAGGAFIIMAKTEQYGLYAARKAVEAIEPLQGVITPFPGGVCRAASMLDSRYKFIKAVTNRAFLPKLRGEEGNKLPADAETALEIVIDGMDEEAVRIAMKEGINEACKHPGVIMISSASFGGKLGDIQIPLREVIS